MSHAWRAVEDFSFDAMSIDDLPAVNAIENASHEFPWTTQNLEDSLNFHHCRVCRQNDEVLGYGILFFVMEEVHLLNLTVAPHRRREGIGLILMRHLIHYAHRLNASSIILEVRTSNVGAQNLYTGLAFEQIGIRRNYYRSANGHENALVMRKVLV